MINEKCFTSEWLGSFRKQKEHGRIQTNILEKMIYALHLLEQLGSNGLEFVFKGGTSLVLLLNEGNRFSIDIDIVCKIEQEHLETILNKVVEGSKFSAVILDEKRSYQAGIPKAHYAFQFDSVLSNKVQGKILLDVLLEDSIYPELILTPIQTKWIESDSVTTVLTPSVDAITGDKLTAYAPNTIKEKFKLLQRGIQSFGTGYLMSGHFRVDDAIVAAARVAHLAAKIMVGDHTQIQQYAGQDIKALMIENPDWNFLNRLKRQPDKSAFFYWYHTVQLF